MMDYKKMIAYLIVCMFCIVLLAAPIFQACEEEEAKEDGESSEGSSTDPSEPVNILDVLLERYPLLNQIIEMILDLFYRWLSSYYTG